MALGKGTEMGVSLDICTLESLAKWGNLGPLAINLTQSIEDDRFPGAIVPAILSNGDRVFYALASDGPTWRRLQPYLFAFVGPTLTDFEGILATPNENEPIEKFLTALGLYAIAVFRPGTYKQAENITLRALYSLQNAISRAPDLAVSQIEPTSLLLARLQDALNGRDFGTAWRIHSILKSELRLDAQNLLQLEFQIYAAAADWLKIRNHSDFERACVMRPSPATAEVLLETLYWSHCQDGMECSIPFIKEDVVQLCHSLLSCVGETTSQITVKLMNFLSIERPNLEVSREIAKITALSQIKTIDRERQGEGTINALSCAKTAFLAFANSSGEDTDQIANAKIAYERLKKKEQANLLSSLQFRLIWSEIQKRIIDTKQQPNDWIEWLNCLDDPEFDASTYASEAPVKWRLSEKAMDTTYSQDLVHAIENVPLGIAEDRLDQFLPFLVNWVATDPQWPRVALCPFYFALLTRIALTPRRGEKTIKSGTILIEGALRCGLNESEYRDLMDMIAMIARDSFNKYTAYDIFEFVEIALDFPAKNKEALHSTAATVATAARGHLNRLSAGQRSAYSQIATRIGWTTEFDDLDSTGENQLNIDLSNLSIGIYTLTESAGRKAREVLESLATCIKIDLNHDHEATARLGALVTRVDLFVVAWASAKHAATNFIKSKRGSKPLIYATGRGASSLIRAIEDYAISMQSDVTNN